jgi:signal transduction histidine kinase
MFRPERGMRQFLLSHRAGGRPPPGAPPPDAPPPPGGAGEFNIMIHPPRFHPAFGAREMVMGDFTAAVRRSDGRWTVVRSSPEPFPSEWQKRAFLVLFAGFAVVAPAGLLFARRITAPLKRFSEAAERLGRDPHASPVSLSGPAEIGAAAEAFNNMQARLRRYIDDRTAMVGAISHDLRTPLARIRFKLEGVDPKVRGSVLTDVAQMEQMIQGVLTFIRNESTPRTREKLDLLSLVECVADDAALVGGDVEILAAQPVTVEGDPVALQRMLVNLVDNALKYGGQARIRVGLDDGAAVVEVFDSGPGLEPDDLERVFQPFYRVDAARNVDDGGIGLGLPIARSTARAHGGDVTLAQADKGLVARVVLPTL